MLHSIPPDESPASPVVATPALPASEGELLESLASELECDPHPESVAAKITDLVSMLDGLKELLEFSTPDEVVALVERLQERAERADDADILQTAIGLTDRERDLVVQSPDPEWALRRLHRVPAPPPAASPPSVLRVTVQATIDALTARKSPS